MVAVHSIHSTYFSDADVSIRFVDGDREVDENDEFVTVCVERVGESDQDITIDLVVSETSPADAEGKNDNFIVSIVMKVIVFFLH